MNGCKDIERVKLPLAPQAYAILVSLAEKPRHGYEIMKFVEEDLMQDVPTATLYRHIRQLDDFGLIEVDASKTKESEDPRRRYYRLTGLGAQVLDVETDRIARMASMARLFRNGGEPVLGMGGA